MVGYLFAERIATERSEDSTLASAKLQPGDSQGSTIT